MEYIYIVYEHDYDCSGIRAVYDTLQKAEAHIAALPTQVARVNHEIQTWEVK